MINEVMHEVADSLRDQFMGEGKPIKQVYVGAVGRVPQNLLPCLVVKGRDTAVVRSSACADQWRHGLTIDLIYDLRKDMTDGALDEGTVRGQDALRELVEGAGETGGASASSLLGFLMRQSGIRGESFAYSLNHKVSYESAAADGWHSLKAAVTLDYYTGMVQRAT